MDEREPVVVALCAYCVGDIREGDEVTRMESGRLVHEHCERGYVRRMYVAYRGVIDADGNVE